MVPNVTDVIPHRGIRRDVVEAGRDSHLPGIWIFFLPAQLSLVIVVFFIFGIGQSGALSLMFAFEADAVEYGEYQTGQRTEGATYAIYSFSRKMSQALAASLVGYALAIGRFVPKALAQPHSALTAIKLVVGLAPRSSGSPASRYSRSTRSPTTASSRSSRNCGWARPNSSCEPPPQLAPSSLN